MEKHIAARLTAATVVVLRGNFSDHAAKTAPFALKVIAKAPPFLVPNNAVLAKGRLPLRTDGACIDVLLEEMRHHSMQNIQETL